MSAPIQDFPGGIYPPANKRQSTAGAIVKAPLPARLILPLQQHTGSPALPCVSVGQRVRKGQLIADAGSAISAALHAPTSGRVSAIGEQPYPHPSGLPVMAIVIETDGLEEWAPLTPCSDFRGETPGELLERIRRAGIAGLGGAGFPTAAKLAARASEDLHTLIINGAECEPYISADDMLMRERASELVEGIDILAHLLQPSQVLIGIEDDKPEAIAALRQAIGERAFDLRVIPTKYPSGGERQLIQILSGREVPSGGLPADIGMVCVNVATAVAVRDAVLLGQPLISRITTLTGAALARPMNVEALLGTPIGELLDFAGLDHALLDRLILGGPLMGLSLPSLHAPLIKTANCLLAASRAELPPPPPALPCIRCGDCAQVCPASLLPQQLHFFARGGDHEQLRAHHLFDCIECGACAYVCPSSIPLVQYYRAAKADIRELQHKQQKAEHSRLRFEQRQERLRREEQRKAEERQARLERAARARESQAAPPAREAPQAAIERIKAEKALGNAGEHLKRLKIDASMARVALQKAEKQLAAHDSEPLRAQVDSLRAAAEQAQAALAAAEAVERAAPSSAPAVDDGALKKAKIEAAMARAQLKKSEQAFGTAPDATQQASLAQLRDAAERAERHLQVLQAATAAKPSEDNAGIAALKNAKIALATRRAELKKAERQGADEAELAPLREALANAERQLHAAEDASGKPAPDLQRIDKRPVDAATRALKTELAYARADLKKLEREGADAARLAVARERLANAEHALAARAPE
ncbi:electron transport complex subunit RsxC [Pseudomonas panipatensis]|uniref:Ion-translocating oxidoreductase complex subunit C n=1 Tax=Pseudomonas panipatensis TaxID=428992 RepID=A0A1G8BPA4_9PSED|nr:electron transport complex subunit RsxC [Pseudomonas panipatensis]SDH34971.1 electron transport complex protein RnfC [Pseudomonas panipatensis]SMP71538.1 electron transport complex protein RnfC [Pseudomonas panipatensis]